MNLLKIQNKFIGAKPYECNIVKGKSNTGKTEALLHRVLNVVHNYAYEEDDKILFVQKEKHLKDKFKLRYEKIQANNTYDYYSLLSSNKEPEFISFDELINRYSEKQRLFPGLKNGFHRTGQIDERFTRRQSYHSRRKAVYR